MDAVVTAGGRVRGTLAEQTGQTIKCLIEFAGRRLIDHVLDALRGCAAIDRIIVVGPPEIRDSLGLRENDLWVDEGDDGPTNFLLGLQATASERVLFATSDLPFLTSAAIDDLLDRCAAGYGIHYPVFCREEIRARFPREASSYMPLRDGDMTGSSVMVFEPRHILEREAEIRALFGARKDMVALAGLLGWGLAAKLALTYKLKLRVVSVERLRRRFEKLAGFPVAVVRGASPELSFDVDHERDWAECLAHLEEQTAC